MSTQIYQELYNKINRKLSGFKLTDKSHISTSYIENYIKNNTFQESIKTLVKDNDFSCKRVLDICTEMMNNLAYPNAPTDWLPYIYQYALSKSFPEAVSIILSEELNTACELYLNVLRIVSDYEKQSNNGTWQSLYPIEFLTSQEESELEHTEEYKKFLKAFKHNFTYEMMKLNGEVFGFNTLDHICGVHYLSLYIARQVKALGIPVDLGRVSGAAAGHDIGKYGCKRAELKRVPYLHYYYTDQWFKRYGINYIRNVALNHSTWDIELENLSIESLILIYSDFRVKNKTFNNKVEMHIYDLQESFDVILSKLDNVNEAKERRYKRVYAKLKDFEDFVKSIGVVTDIKKNLILHENKVETRNYSLMQGYDIIENLKYLAIKHNINLMTKLRDEYSLDIIIETARSEKDWKNFREYIRIFEEYSTYLTQNQKLQTIKFLFENLTHPEDDIRRHCAELMGTLIAIFDEDYRKDIPENVKIETPTTNSFTLFRNYIDLMLSPSHKFIAEHRMWIGYNLNLMVDAFFSHCRKNLIPLYREVVLDLYNDDSSRSIETNLFLLETSKYLPLEPYDNDLKTLLSYVLSMLNKRSSLLRLSSLEVTYCLVPKLPRDIDFIKELKEYLQTECVRSKFPTENHLKYKIAKLLDTDKLIEIFQHYNQLDESRIQEMFLSNLKTATEWLRKKLQVNLLLDYTLSSPKNHGLHTAIHFCNLLKVSALENVRNRAGSAILKIMPSLTLAERNEVAIELLRALEIEGNRFTEYIPHYLGKAVLFLQPKELDEIIDDLVVKIKSSEPNVKALILKTIGVAVSHYPDYMSRFNEKENLYDERLIRMLGILLNGLGDYNFKVKLAAFSTIGKDIFGTEYLNNEQKVHIFKLVAKKILTLTTDNKNEELLFLTNSAGLNHIYRFMSDYTFFNGEIDIPIPEKVAFFPGTFDPFSLTHKEIAVSIRDLGFEVYLSIDEFSWSKKTLPNLLRRNILSMSVASEPNIYIYPDIYQTNISNNNDLKTLRDNFKNSTVYMVAGGDVILNASSYKLPRTENSIHTFPHIIFERGSHHKLIDAAKNIDGEVCWLTLASKYTDISSSQIRNCIDENRDISTLIDPLAQRYIYDNGFYQREPQDKSSISSLWIEVQVTTDFTPELIKELCAMQGVKSKDLSEKLIDISHKPSCRIIMLKNSNTNEILAFSVVHWIRSGMLYEELKSKKVSEYLRDHSLGRILMIDGMFIRNTEKNKSLEPSLVTETLAFCISKDYEYAVFKSALKELYSPAIGEVLKLQGFTELNTLGENTPTFVVDMSTPCILNLDIENILKEPFRNDPKIRQIVNSTRKKLQEALTKLYPGELVLAFDSNMLHQSMIRKICLENGVDTEVSSPRKLGEAMCVPYGDILDRYVIPNTVTKALHTEKFFHPGVKDFNIAQFPHYLDLETQVRMLKSFDRPVMLVDNLLHKGYRIKALDPLFKNEEIKVQKILAGILSGRGKDIMDIQGREVDSVYFIPRLRLWFNESALYPFVGGDAIWRGRFPERNLVPSINLIMPYTSPAFIRNTTPSSIYNLSKVSIENSLDILSILEEEYHVLNERNLSLSNLGQVFTIPRCPDHGNNIEYDLSINPSQYLKNDLELLMRYENMISRL